jgi:hypothetical protein
MAIKDTVASYAISDEKGERKNVLDNTKRRHFRGIKHGLRITKYDYRTRLVIKHTSEMPPHGHSPRYLRELYGPNRRVTLQIWLSTSLAPVLSAATTLASSSPNPKARSPNASTVIAPYAATKFAGGWFIQVMPKSVVDNIPPGPKLDAFTAEKVFGWQNIYTHDGAFVGKKQD